jgi:predicted XRE-type DNA-binding protein
MARSAKTLTSTPEPEPVYASSGNVFDDLGFPDAQDMLLKAELARRIASILRHRHLTQQEAADVLGIDQPKVSALLRGRLAGFSTERLLRFLLTLGRDVTIVVKKKPTTRAQASLQVVTA